MEAALQLLERKEPTKIIDLSPLPLLNLLFGRDIDIRDHLQEFGAHRLHLMRSKPHLDVGKGTPRLCATCGLADARGIVDECDFRSRDHGYTL